MKVWVYRSRNGNHGVFTGDRAGYDKAIERQTNDNGGTREEFAEEGELEVGGSFENGHSWVDDGGSIELFEVI